jgi:PST family polysaccharide transporter
MSNPMSTELLPSPLARDLPAGSSAIMRIFGRNTLWLWIDLGALRIGTMLAGLFLIRYFGPTNFGIYSTALATGWVANALIDLGLTRYAARAVAADIQQTRPILALTLVTTVGTALATMVVLLVALKAGIVPIAYLAAGFVLCNFEGTSSLCASILTADLRSKAILPGSILSVCGLILMTIATVWLRLSVLDLLLGLSVRSALVMSFRLWQLRSYWPAASHWTMRQFRRVARSASPFFANNLTQVGYGKIAILSLGAVSSQAEVGWFAAAFTIADIVPQWSYALSGALLPVWTKLFEQGRTEEMVTLRRRLLDGIMCVTIPVWICMAVFAKPLCNLIGTNYVPSATVLSIISIKCVLTVLDGFFGHGFLVAANRVRERQRALAKCLLLLGLLSAVFGYFWGAVGVGIAFVVSDSYLILQYLRISSRIGLKIEWPSMLPVGIAAVLMTCCALVLPEGINFALRGLAAVAVYTCTLLVLSKEQLLNLGATLRECVSKAPECETQAVGPK